MAFIVSALLPFAVCVALMVGTSALWWRSFHAPWPFVVVGFLALLGVHRVAEVVVQAGKAVGAQGYLLEGPTTAAAVQLVERNLVVEALATSTAVLVLGFPLLLWLKRALPAP
jgi:hypothetical protein